MSTQKTAAGAEPPQDQAGFSLIELIIGLSVMVTVLLVILVLFDVNGRVSRVQMQVTDMQQSLRIAQQKMITRVRMAGRGGLPQAFAVRTQQGVPQDTKIGTAPDAPVVLENTDILTVRGVFSSPIYQIRHTEDASFAVDEINMTGTLLVDSISPSNVPQPLDSFEEVAANNAPLSEALILVSTVDDSLYAVVELTAAAFEDTVANGVPVRRATLSFTFNPGQGTYTDKYLALTTGGAFPSQLNKVAFAGLVEEYRYYIRQDYGVVDDDQSGLAPTLSRARMYPGTEAVYGPASNAEVTIADNIVDLQVALGMDRNSGGGLTAWGQDGLIDENPTDTANDDWLYNDSGDVDTLAEWAPVLDANGDAVGFDRRFYYLRINTLARTDRFDIDYTSQPIANIENRDYNEPQIPTGSERQERAYRRRLIQTVVDMRNVG